MNSGNPAVKNDGMHLRSDAGHADKSAFHIRQSELLGQRTVQQLLRLAP